MLISFKDLMNLADGDLQSSLNNSSGHAASTNTIIITDTQTPSTSVHHSASTSESTQKVDLRSKWHAVKPRFM